MDRRELFSYIFLVVVLGIPALAVSARIALRPIVEALVRLREEFSRVGSDARTAVLEAEVGHLRAETDALRDELRALQSATDFDRQLRAGKSDSA